MRRSDCITCPAEIKKQIQLEIGYVLFMDMVGYSTRLIDEQRALRDTLNEIVRDTEQFRDADAAGTLIKSPDGRRHGACFPREPGGTGRVRAGNQPRIKSASESALANGRAQRSGERSCRCKRSDQRGRGGN